MPSCTKQARAGAADLALVEPDGVDHAFDGGVDIGVVKHDEGRLAAQFQRQRLAAAGGFFADQAADIGRTGKGDLVHIRVGHDGRSRGAVAGDHVQHAGGQAGLRGQFGEQQGRQWREFGRFQYHGIAERQRRGDFPRQHQQREVPRHDLADHADRHLVGEFAFLQLRPAGMVIEVARHQRHVDIARFADRLAVVERFDHGEQAGVALHHARQGVQVAGARMAADGEPVFLGGARGGNCCVNVSLRALRDARQRLAGGRFIGVEQRACRGGRERAVDEMAEAVAVARQPGARVGVAFRGRAVVHGVEVVFNARLAHMNYPIAWRWKAE